MPQLIEYIDAIARREARDVLSVSFFSGDSLEILPDFDYELSDARKQITQWLDENGISWRPCGEFASENYILPYLGSIYIAIPFDLGDATYQKLADLLENPDGTMKLPGAYFFVTPLASAMKNKHHDDAGFWEKLAERF